MKMTASFCFVLLCALVFAGQATARLRQRDCDRGARVIGEFYENPCRRSNVYDPFEAMRSNAIVNVETYRNHFIQFCSVAMPAIRQCFDDMIRVCSDSQQQYFKAMAYSTSSLCEANSTKISPWLNWVLARLTDEEVVYNDSCSNRHEEYLLRRHCREVSRNSTALNREQFQTMARTGTVEDLVPVIQSMFSHMAECVIRGMRDDPSRCPTWRSRALDSAFNIWGPPPLGLQLQFTPDMAAEMFGYDD
ncbi:uncharacterized protein LOC143276525 [Babylonia areolata]|uniref:uncharacterized protein LOC143276525 n=1 Tax=Babylonia areolata TaxID=304850 RepID=UPI003FCFFEE0